MENVCQENFVSPMNQCITGRGLYTLSVTLQLLYYTELPSLSRAIICSHLNLRNNRQFQVYNYKRPAS